MNRRRHAVPENTVSREVADRNCLISILLQPRRSSTSDWVLGAPKYLLNSRCGPVALSDADSPACTEKEIGTVSPMRVRPGSMLGKGRGVGRIAASVVRWVRAVPLGIKHDPRRVGGLCAPNRTSAPALPGTSEPAARSGVDGGSSVARALPQVRKPTRVRLAAFLAVLDGRKTRRAEKIFFRKKNGHMANLASRRAQKWVIFFPMVPKFTPGKVTEKGS